MPKTVYVRLPNLPLEISEMPIHNAIRIQCTAAQLKRLAAAKAIIQEVSSLKRLTPEPVPPTAWELESRRRDLDREAQIWDAPTANRKDLGLYGTLGRGPLPFPVLCGQCDATMEYVKEYRDVRYRHKKPCPVTGMRYTVQLGLLAEGAYKMLRLVGLADPTKPLTELLKFIDEANLYATGPYGRSAAFVFNQPISYEGSSIIEL
jgi:hypothetical protein